MSAGTRQRRTAVSANWHPPTSPRKPATSPPPNSQCSLSPTALAPAAGLLCLLCVLLCLRSVLLYPHPARRRRRPAPSAPDDEPRIAALRLSAPPPEEALREGPPERLLVCMPTVARAGGVEYVSNAVKSWRVATGGVGGAARLLVFDMNVGADARRRHAPAFLARVFAAPPPESWGSAGGAAAWLRVLQRAREDVREPARRTHGDGEARVRWRAKEALDYAEVLERCVRAARGRYVAVVQDDVLFAAAFAGVVEWLDGLEGRVGEAWCSASLFDVGSGSGARRVDGAQVLQSSNMVARVWRVDGEGGKSVGRFVSYLRAKFDVSPVDWLANDWCRRERRRTWAAVPSLVRHRGRVSSFAENEREGSLT